MRKVITKKKKKISTGERLTGSEEETGVRTSTPLRVKVRRRINLIRKKKQQKKPIESLNLIKKKLDEGLNVSLSTGSESGNGFIKHDHRKEVVGTAAEEGEHVQFDTMSSSILNELNKILSDLEDNSSDAEWPNLSDPDLE